MAIEDDVIVIGGGIAGCTAALSAAREGVSVRLISAKQSTLRSASGLIDVLGYAPDGDGPVADPFEALSDLPEGHPYERVGRDAVEAGLALFDEITGDAYLGDHTTTNALVPTQGGVVKPTARYPVGTANGLASDDRDTLLVGFETLPDFDAPLAADTLQEAGVPYDVRGETVQFPGDLNDDAKITRFAHLLDENETIRHEGRSVGARTALADQLRSLLDDEERVGLPAVLGETAHTEVLDRLQSALGAAVFEVPSGPPSLPGQRLEALLYEQLRAEGVHVTTSNPVVDATTADGVIDEIYVEKNGNQIPYAAEEYVLATGGLVGKGIDSDREVVREPIFGCHVPHPEDRYDWFDMAAFGDHPFARFGVSVDQDLRPLDADASIEYENLRAAGGVLGGYDFAAEKSGAGVSLATGYAAGRGAGATI
jgi:glycerol-3-phosphate dehydrogenase subunit B